MRSLQWSSPLLFVDMQFQRARTNIFKTYRIMKCDSQLLGYELITKRTDITGFKSGCTMASQWRHLDSEWRRARRRCRYGRAYGWVRPGWIIWSALYLEDTDFQSTEPTWLPLFDGIYKRLQKWIIKKAAFSICASRDPSFHKVCQQAFDLEQLFGVANWWAYPLCFPRPDTDLAWCGTDGITAVGFLSHIQQYVNWTWISIR